MLGAGADFRDPNNKHTAVQDNYVDCPSSCRDQCRLKGSVGKAGPVTTDEVSEDEVCLVALGAPSNFWTRSRLMFMS